MEPTQFISDVIDIIVKNNLPNVKFIRTGIFGKYSFQNGSAGENFIRFIFTCPNENNACIEIMFDGTKRIIYVVDDQHKDRRELKTYSHTDGVTVIFLGIIEQYRMLLKL